MRTLPFHAFAALVAVVASVQISVHSEQGCTGSSLIGSYDVNSTFLNLCELGVASVAVPPGISIAIFEQCRTDHAILTPNPSFKHFLSASTDLECVNFVTEDGNPVERITLAVMSGPSDVCLEYALHAHIYCKPHHCGSDCRVALHAAREFASNCEGVDMTSLANLRYEQYHSQQPNSSSEESDLFDGDESDPHNATAAGHFSHMCYKGFIHLVHRSVDRACSLPHLLVGGLLLVGVLVLFCAICCVCSFARNRRRTMLIGHSPIRPTKAIPVSVCAPHFDKDGCVLLETVLPPSDIEIVTLQPSHIIPHHPFS